MPPVFLSCGLLVIVTTALHYEVLRGLNFGLPLLAIPNRMKLFVVIISAFFAHAAEMAMYGITLYVVDAYLRVGGPSHATGFSLTTSLFLSAEMYTSVGFGDIPLLGLLRLFAGAEALNGLLLIGWSTSFTYLSMEKFWNAGSSARHEPEAR